ncbi:MAG: hypothetical protein QF682_00335 [Candidatus Thermoplasmatota archaeon]|jgi:hypothetical protein|nr:hypothetical protein [Candidatus Thermoplasmatota archaeon]
MIPVVSAKGGGSGGSSYGGRSGTYYGGSYYDDEEEDEEISPWIYVIAGIGLVFFITWIIFKNKFKENR